MKLLKIILLIFFTSPIWGLFMLFCFAVLSDDSPPEIINNESSYYEYDNR